MAKSKNKLGKASSFVKKDSFLNVFLFDWISGTLNDCCVVPISLRALLWPTKILLTTYRKYSVLLVTNINKIISWVILLVVAIFVIIPDRPIWTLSPLNSVCRVGLVYRLIEYVFTWIQVYIVNWFNYCNGWEKSNFPSNIEYRQRKPRLVVIKEIFTNLAKK